MKLLIYMCILSWAAPAATAEDGHRLPVGSDAGPGGQIDWPAFMAGNDMHWKRMPGRWQDAPHFGNAMLGSMLYQAGDSLRLQIFRADVQDHRDDSHGWTAYSRPRFGIGSFHLKPVGKLTGCVWRKDLWNAELTGTITTDKGRLDIRHYVHAGDMAIVTEVTPSAGEKGASWSWAPMKAASTRPGYPTKQSQVPGFAKRYGEQYNATLKLSKPNPPGKDGNEGGVSLWQQDLLAGGQYVTAWSEKTEADGRRIFVATVANSYPETTARDEAVNTVRKTLAGYSEQWTEQHRNWWHDYYRRSYVHIPDIPLENLYWQTIYRYGCTTRLGRAFVDTPGIWFQGGGWCYTTTDWNIQAAHWGVCSANRLELGFELLERFHTRQDELIKAVRPVEWQADSAYLPIEVAGDLRGNREQDMRYYWCVGNLPWALNNFWSFYRHSMDDAMLRDKLFPLLRRSINLYLHMLEEGKDGKLHLVPTYSPETGVYNDCNYDLALLKWGCHTLLNSCRRLKLDDPLIPRWQEVLKRLVDFPTDANGFMIGSNKAADATHRHASHLLMIYPLHLVNIEQGGTADLLEKSYRLFDRTSGLPAMVQTHAGPMGASLGLADSVLNGLQRQRRDLHGNGMWHSPPCLESSLGMANTVQEMLLQSWCDPADRSQTSTIRILPAVPEAWQDIEFRDLRTEGAFLVSARREGGRTTWVRIKSLAGEPCFVRPAMTGTPKVEAARRVSLKPVGNGCYVIDLKQGEEVMLSQAFDE